MRTLRLAARCAPVVLLLACQPPSPSGSPSDTRACVPNASASCACPDGRTGAQVCNAEGSAFGDCVCTGGTSSSTGSSGTSGLPASSSSVGASSSAPPSSGVAAASSSVAGHSSSQPDASSTGGTASSVGMGGGRPHPLYPALDLDTLPGNGGGARGPYEPPALPVTSRTVTVTTTGSQARNEVANACSTPGTRVEVPDAAGNLGTLDLGNVTDCDLALGPAVVVTLLYLGHLPGPTVAPVTRVRVRGGQLGQVMVDPGSSDLVLDGVTLNNGVVPPASRQGTGIYLIHNDAAGTFVNRFAMVRSHLRMVATEPDGQGNRDGCAYLAGHARNVLFAGNNVVTAGNRNAWGFRIGGGENQLFVDNVVRVSFHKLIRMNDGPVDYVYVSGGVWMREATLTAGGLGLNDAFAQLGDLGTDHVFIRDTQVHLLAPEPVSFGASFGEGQAGRLWEARRIHWFAQDADVVSDAVLNGYASSCHPQATCDYGAGTHTYTYNTIPMLPANAWLDLPGIDTDNPDALPVVTD